jgi:hypothetical protein
MFDMVRIYSKIPSQSADANASFGMIYLDTVDPFAKIADLQLQILIQNF